MSKAPSFFDLIYFKDFMDLTDFTDSINSPDFAFYSILDTFVHTNL
jgi:hypothetical protein